MVKGLVIHTVATASGRLTRNQRLSAAAINICTGNGMKATKTPSAKPPATERRFKCHKLGSCKRSPNIRKLRCSRSLVRSGIQRLISCFATAQFVLQRYPIELSCRLTLQTYPTGFNGIMIIKDNFYCLLIKKYPKFVSI